MHGAGGGSASDHGTAGQDDVCLLLADLSGYTEYVAASEPEHAPAMAGDLVEAVVRQLRPAFQLEKLEGDAAFLLAPIDGWREPAAGCDRCGLRRVQPPDGEPETGHDL